MNLLLDSNALIWLLGEDSQLSPRAREAIAEPTISCFYSTATVWELEIKRGKGKLDMSDTWQNTLPKLGLVEIRIDSTVATASARLPWHHRDPFDRLIVAQALALDLTLVTRDTFLATYGIRLIAT
ncbi:MAG: type II toxin-antitoxin system VapC family toxin [Chthoniobacterales bacterium]